MVFFGDSVTVYGVDLVSIEEFNEPPGESELIRWVSDHRHDFRWPSK